MGLKALFGNKNVTNIELISIHIPKTGGRTFYEILNFVYGNKIDKRTKREEYFPNENQKKESFEVSADISVIHGHFHFNEVKDKIGKNTRLITWMREPVDRVISNYYFFMYRIATGKVNPKQLAKAGFTLLEYARLESARNVMSRFLEGSKLEDYYFIGDFHEYQNEIKLLGKLLNWPENIPDFFENKTDDLNIFNICSTKPSDISADMRDEIASLNQNDQLLYQRNKKLRLMENIHLKSINCN